MVLPLRTRATLLAVIIIGTAARGRAEGETIRRARELAASAAGTRVTVRGTVTRYRAGRSISLQDASGGIFAYTDQAQTVEPGDIVEVTGDAGTDPEGAPSINHATYGVFGSGPPPAAVPARLEDLESGTHEAALVSIEGELERIESARDEYALVLSVDDTEFTAWVPRETAPDAGSLPLDSRVRVSGVAARTNEPDGRNGFELLLRNGADIVVVQRPPWWTSRHIPAVATALAGASGALLLYAFVLRRQVRRQTAVIAQRMKPEADLKEQYRQAQKMEAVGRLAAGIAHDFNNIMTVVLGHAEVLGLELRDQAELMESVEEIRQSAHRAAGVTRQLLAFGRRQRLETAAVDLNEVVTSMTTLLRRVLGGDIEVRAETAPRPVTVMIDRGQLEQTLLNLAVNARDAMASGGRLTLSVAAGADGTASAALLRVADTGAGIPADAQPHIFDPFFTTKDVGHGSGLGLAMVYGFIQQTGGSIRFDTSGQGTMFELTFPLAGPLTA